MPAIFPLGNAALWEAFLAEFLKVAVLKEYLVRRLERAAMSLDSCEDRVVSLRCPGGGYGRTGDWNGSGDRKSDD